MGTNMNTSRDNPYAAPTAHVDDAMQDEGQVLAERLTRLGAVLIDIVIALIAYTPLFIWWYQRTQGSSAALFGMIGGIFVLALLVYNLMLLYRDGQTIGKKLLNVRIVRTDGSRAGLARILFVRILPVTLLGMIPFLGFFISLTDPLLIFRDSRQCLHDQIADTVVVKV
jgi:uncharacterized RDD family membrane protein YckC